MSESVRALKSRLAIASGISSENIGQFLPFIDLYLVSTSISINFHELDESKVRALALIMAKYEVDDVENND